MSVGRLGPTHGPDDRELAEGVVEMIVAADDVSDAHVVIVDHHRQHVGRRSVRSQQHEIVQLDILHGHPALNLVVDDRLAFARCLQADDERPVALVFRDLAPRALYAEWLALGAGALALLGQFFLRQ